MPNEFEISEDMGDMDYYREQMNPEPETGGEPPQNDLPFDTTPRTGQEDGIPDPYNRQQPQPQQGQQQGQQQPKQDVANERIAKITTEQQRQFLQSLPPEIKKGVNEILGQFEAQNYNEKQQLAQYAEAIEQTSAEILPIKEYFDAVQPKLKEIGVTDAGEYFDSLIDVDIESRENPAEFIAKFALKHRLTHGDLDRAADAVMNRINDPYYIESQRLKKEKAELEKAQQLEKEKYTQTTYQQNLKYWTHQVNDFISERGPDGKAAHPFYSMVEKKMGEIYKQTGNTNLQELYDNACWTDPDIRNYLVYNQRQQPQKKPITGTFNMGNSNENNVSRTQVRPFETKEDLVSKIARIERDMAGGF